MLHLLQTTVLGSFLDPLSDKVMVACLAIALCAKGVLVPWIAACVVARDVALVTGVAVYRYNLSLNTELRNETTDSIQFVKFSPCFSFASVLIIANFLYRCQLP